MAGPDGLLVNGPVEDFTADDRTRQHDEESSGLGRGGGEASRDVAVKEDLDAGCVHEDGRHKVVTYCHQD